MNNCIPRPTRDWLRKMAGSQIGASRQEQHQRSGVPMWSRRRSATGQERRQRPFPKAARVPRPKVVTSPHLADVRNPTTYEPMKAAEAMVR